MRLSLIPLWRTSRVSFHWHCVLLCSIAASAAPAAEATGTLEDPCDAQVAIAQTLGYIPAPSALPESVVELRKLHDVATKLYSCGKLELAEPLFLLASRQTNSAFIRFDSVRLLSFIDTRRGESRFEELLTQASLELAKSNIESLSPATRDVARMLMDNGAGVLAREGRHQEHVEVTRALFVLTGDNPAVAFQRYRELAVSLALAGQCDSLEQLLAGIYTTEGHLPELVVIANRLLGMETDCGLAIVENFVATNLANREFAACPGAAFTVNQLANRLSKRKSSELVDLAEALFAEGVESLWVEGVVTDVPGMPKAAEVIQGVGSSAFDFALETGRLERAREIGQNLLARFPDGDYATSMRAKLVELKSRQARAWRLQLMRALLVVCLAAFAVYFAIRMFRSD